MDRLETVRQAIRLDRERNSRVLEYGAIDLDLASVFLQPTHHFGDWILLEQPNSGNTGSTRLQTGVCVFESHTSQGKDADFVRTGTAELIEPHGRRIREANFLEDGSQYDEVSLLRGSCHNLLFGVAGNGDKKIPGFVVQIASYGLSDFRIPVAAQYNLGNPAHVP